MSLKGKTSANQVLRGRINRLDTLCLSAYEIALKNGFEGTEEEWLASLRGEPGEKGEKGDGTLIVTGKIPATESTVSGVAQASVKNMALSHTIEEIAEAFQAGRDVTIRLNAVYPGMDNFGGWNFHYAELNVTKAEVVMAGYYTLVAYGTGYVGVATCTSAPIFVSGSLSTNPQIYVRTKTA